VARLAPDALRLPPERLRLVACGAADATVLLTLCALRIYLVPRSFEGSAPVSELGFLRRMTDGPFRHLRLRGPDRVLPRADFALFLGEVFHQIVGPLQLCGERLFLRRQLRAFRIQRARPCVDLSLPRRQSVR